MKWAAAPPEKRKVVVQDVRAERAIGGPLTSEAERLVAAVARGVTMAGGAIRAAKARMNFAQSADPGEQLG